MVIRIFLVQPNGSILILNTMVRNHFVQNYNVTIGSKKNIKHSQNIKKKHKSNILAKLVKTHIFVKHFFLKIQSSILDFLASKHFVFFSFFQKHEHNLQKSRIWFHYIFEHNGLGTILFKIIMELFVLRKKYSMVTRLKKIINPIY